MKRKQEEGPLFPEETQVSWDKVVILYPCGCKSHPTYEDGDPGGQFVLCPMHKALQAQDRAVTECPTCGCSISNKDGSYTVFLCGCTFSKGIQQLPCSSL